MAKSKPNRRNSEFERFLDVLEEYLSTACELAPRNTPRGREFRGALKEFNKMVGNIVKGDMATARNLMAVVDIHTLRRLDERVKQLRAVQLTSEMTNLLRRTSR